MTDSISNKKPDATSRLFSDQTSDLINDFEKFKKETEELQAHNEAWLKEFQRLGSLTQSGNTLEKEKNFYRAITVYLEAVEFGEKSSLLNIYNYALAIERVIILYGKTKQKENLIQFLHQKIEMYPEFRETKNWAVRLSKLESEGQTKNIPLKPNDIVPQKANNPTIGKRLNDFKTSLPEFNFYYDLPSGDETFSYNHKVSIHLFNILREYREAFSTIKSLAKIAENEGDYKKAIEAYEKLLIEECEDPEPYERLIKLYSKLKWIIEEKSTIERAIIFFKKLKEVQLAYTLSLAKKYGMENKALEYINQEKKIFYYGGSFELYNPQTNRILKWQSRLQKLNKIHERIRSQNNSEDTELSS